MARSDSGCQMSIDDCTDSAPRMLESCMPDELDQSDEEMEEKIESFAKEFLSSSSMQKTS